jgi:hypothetical protein
LVARGFLQEQVEHLLTAMAKEPETRWDLVQYDNPGDWVAELRPFLVVPGVTDLISWLRRVGFEMDQVVAASSRVDAMYVDSQEEETLRDEGPVAETSEKGKEKVAEPPATMEKVAEPPLAVDAARDTNVGDVPATMAKADAGEVVAKPSKPPAVLVRLESPVSLAYFP